MAFQTGNCHADSGTVVTAAHFPLDHTGAAGLYSWFFCLLPCRQEEMLFSGDVNLYGVINVKSQK